MGIQRPTQTHDILKMFVFWMMIVISQEYYSKSFTKQRSFLCNFVVDDGNQYYWIAEHDFTIPPRSGDIWFNHLLADATFLSLTTLTSHECWVSCRWCWTWSIVTTDVHRRWTWTLATYQQWAAGIRHPMRKILCNFEPQSLLTNITSGDAQNRLALKIKAIALSDDFWLFQCTCRAAKDHIISANTTLQSTLILQLFRTARCFCGHFLPTAAEQWIGLRQFALQVRQDYDQFTSPKLFWQW